MIRLLWLPLAVIPVQAAAGAWTRDEGRFYLNTSYSRIHAGTYFAPDLSKVPIVPYTQHSIGLYAEVGVVDRWLTVVFDGQLYRRNALEGQGFTDGVSDVRVGAWTGLVVAPVRLSLGVLVGLPTGDSAPRGGPDPDAAAIARSLPTGDGEADVEARLALGYSFGGKRWPLVHYVLVEAGYWRRSNNFADAFTYNIELGTKFPFSFLDRFWVIARFFGVESFASNLEAAQNATGLGNGVLYNAYGVQLYGRIWKGLGASVGLDSAFRARSIAAGANLRFSLSYER